MSSYHSTLLACAFLATTTLLPAQEEAGNPLDRYIVGVKRDVSKENPRLQWFNDARFGMFIHWGPYSLAAGEWNGKKNYGEWLQVEAKIPNAEYEKLSAAFNPVKFDAKAWARMAKDAGMRYLVFTTKHHDGFCMFDSKYTDYTITKFTPYKKDLTKALAEACQEEGIQFCTYYSTADWHHPEAPAEYMQRGFHGAPNPNADVKKYVKYMHDQVEELVTNYGRIGILWFDGGGAFRTGPKKLNNEERSEVLDAENLVKKIHARQPWCLINNRLGAGADYGTPEQKIPPNGFGPGISWESCMTMNRHWGYNKADKNWKSADTLIRNLVECASKGGNYLLNVGPTGEGEFPPESIQRLADIGKWMRVNSEAIYGTTASPLAFVPEWGRLTQKGSTLYMFVFKSPKDGKILLPLNNKLKSARVLGQDDVKVSGESSDAGITVALKDIKIDPAATVIALELDGKSVVK
ncbi:MAG: alpha-L-fucosidase [Puniceicoccales bacterium]|jgi:alpha-L-fucosidase|nr:alpha-L-fucosidase [Puniceicoccales bacterium]